MKDSSGSGLGQLAGSWERGVGCSSTKKQISRLHEEKLTSQVGLYSVDILSYWIDFNKIFFSWFNNT
jgi:hypothetical protein